MIHTSADPWRPATVFLSYSRKDAAEVASLQQQLQIRGLRAWRDVNDLELGSLTREEIVQAIEQQADAFLLYVTPSFLTSTFIWQVEVPTAIGRWERHRAFGVVPVLRGVTLAQLRQACAEHGCPDLTAFNALILPDDSGEAADTTMNARLREAGQRLLRAALRLRLARIGGDADTYEPRLCFHTFPYMSPASSLDLDLDWTALFTPEDHWPAQEIWLEVMLPALHDVRQVLSTLPHGRTLHLNVQAHLAAAVALGFVFSLTSRFSLLLSNEQKRFAWSTQETITDAEPLRSRTYKGTGETSAAVVEILVSRQIIPAVTHSLSALGISYGHRLQLEVKKGVSNEAVSDGAHALAIARQVGRELRTLSDRDGVGHIHLFLACPAELAVLIGHHLNALGTVTVYEYRKQTREYISGCTLQH
jgi:hypothetical protein